VPSWPGALMDIGEGDDRLRSSPADLPSSLSERATGIEPATGPWEVGGRTTVARWLWISRPYGDDRRATGGSLRQACAEHGDQLSLSGSTSYAKLVISTVNRETYLSSNTFAFQVQ